MSGTVDTEFANSVRLAFRGDQSAGAALADYLLNDGAFGADEIKMLVDYGMIPEVMEITPEVRVILAHMVTLWSPPGRTAGRPDGKDHSAAETLNAGLDYIVTKPPRGQAEQYKEQMAAKYNVSPKLFETWVTAANRAIEQITAYYVNLREKDAADRYVRENENVMRQASRIEPLVEREWPETDADMRNFVISSLRATIRVSPK